MSSSSDPSTNNPFGAWLPPFMNPANLNPFGALPGMPGSGAPDAAAWMKAIDPAEIEKRIRELQVVELWLQSQVSMVQMSIQTMTMQKQSMEALHAAAKGMSEQSAAMAAAASAAMPGTTPAPKKAAPKTKPSTRRRS